MKISFAWESRLVVDDKQKNEIETNITEEINNNIDLLKKQASEVFVTIEDDPPSQSLIGVAKNKKEEALLKITYSLLEGNRRAYIHPDKGSL